MARIPARPAVPAARRIRRSAWLIGAALVGGAVVWRVVGDSEEAELGRRLDRVSEALRTERGEPAAARHERIGRVLGELATKDLVLTLPEFPLPRAGTGPIVDGLTEGLGQYEKTTLLPGRVSSRVERGHQSASSSVEATFRAESAAGLYLDRRNAVVRWTKQNGEWRIASVFIAERDHAQPEARP
jgi:hypothetical protein